MKVRLHHSAEVVPDAGGLSANGVLKLLGQPPFSPITLLVREAVQNSWDARINRDEGVIHFEIHGQKLVGSRLESLRNFFDSTSLSQLPHLSEVLLQDSVDVVEILDYGTVGLNGPIIASDPREPRRFVNFIRNIGVEKGADEAGSGGTYGFGKGSYYRVSAGHTIVIHTRTRNLEGNPESRLICAGLGNAFNDGTRSYTGRHFFGIEGVNTANPVIGKATDQLAAEIGFGVPEGETGTSILIIGFSPGSSDEVDDSTQAIDLELSLSCMLEQLIWQCWPKLVDLGGGPEIICEVSFEGRTLEVGKWEQLPVFRNLIEQYSKCFESDARKISYKVQKLELGSFATDKFLKTSDTVLGNEGVIGFEIPTHHIALIRAPHLVVKYHPGPELSAPEIAWNGVFLASDDPEIDRVFASAEPPSHDDWIYRNLQGRNKNIIRHAMSKIDEALRNSYKEDHIIVDSNGQVSILSSFLGELLGFGGMSSSEPPTTRKPASSRASKARASKYDPDHVNIILKEEIPFAEAIFNIADLPSGHSLLTSAASAIDSASTIVELPDGMVMPHVTGWRVELGAKHFSGVEARIPAKLLAASEGQVKVYSPLINGRASVVQLILGAE